MEIRTQRREPQGASGRAGWGRGTRPRRLATENDRHPGPWWANGPSIISLRETLSGGSQGNTLGARAVAQGLPGTRLWGFLALSPRGPSSLHPDTMCA